MDRIRHTVNGLAAVFFAVVLAFLCACSSSGYVPSGQSGPATIQEPEAQSPYDWNCLSWDERGRASYVVDGQVRSRTGVDVSEHNEGIDWQAVAADGIDFAIVRAAWRGNTEGGLFADEYFEQNYTGARDAGLDVGLYVFSQALDAEEGRAEAEFALELLDGRPLELPIAFDHERTSDGSGRADNVSHENLTAAARAFCDTVEAAGYSAVIYGNAYEFARLDINSFARQGYWLAQYDEKPGVPLELVMWQYSYQGSVDGISTNADLNIELAHVLDEQG